MKISFTGDVSLTGKLKEAITNDSLKIDNEILEIFKNSDFNIVNLEGPSTNKEVVFDKHIQVKNPLASIEYLKLGFIFKFLKGKNSLSKDNEY